MSDRSAIDLNLELHVTHIKTTFANDRDLLDNSNLLDALTLDSSDSESSASDGDFSNFFSEWDFHLNWDEDRLQISFEYDSSSVHLQFKNFFFKHLTGSDPKQLQLHVISDRTTTTGSTSEVNVEVSVFDTILRMFSPYEKKFEIVLDFVYNSKERRAFFEASVPNFKQDGWETKAYPLLSYYPETIGGNELSNLFRKKFALKPKSSPKDKELWNLLKEYSDAPTTQKFDESYFDFLHMMQLSLAIEDLDQIELAKQHTLEMQHVFKFENCNVKMQNEIENHLKAVMCKEKMKEFIEGMHVIINNDRRKKLADDILAFTEIRIVDSFVYQQYHDSPKRLLEIGFKASIAFIFNKIILINDLERIEKGEDMSNRRNLIEIGRPYHIQFIPNRVSIRVCQRAVQTAIEKEMYGYLSNFKSEASSRNRENLGNSCELVHIDEMIWKNSTVSRNEEQQKAVMNIINRTSFPAPYIVFGPPGTGKTTTIIEAISQIVALKPDVHILIAVGNNSTCDDFTTRLLNHVSGNKILRLYSPALVRKPEKIHPELLKISNFRDRIGHECKIDTCLTCNESIDPSYQEFYTAKIVVSTLISCGRFVTAGIKSNHFDYIFIDEAACQGEQQTLVPIAGLGAGKNRIHAQIVVSGDHRQLGMIVKNSKAIAMGMEMSMMERMMNSKLNYVNMESKYVSQLIQNYRSHPSIIEFSNKQFYGGKLQYCCPREIQDFAIGWDKLIRNSHFPVLFHSVNASSTRTGTSWFNDSEGEIVIQYVTTLLKEGVNNAKVKQEDIGVVTPYRGQRLMLREKLRRKYPKLEIGTIDSFQGKEKKIIILNTVRSKTRGIGFLESQKRLNVSLTRAQSLMIIVGNDQTLAQTPIWAQFIAFCVNNNAIIKY